MQKQSILQQREKALYRYSAALEQGDIDTVIMVLQQAEHDHLLEQMILEMHEDVYQHEDTPLIYDYDSLQNTPPVWSKPLSKRSTRETPRIRQVVGTFQRLVAVLVVAALLGGFLVLFSARHISGNTGGQPQEQTTFPCAFDIGPTNPGLKQICTDHLYQNIQITKTIGPLTLKIFQVYADANQIVIAYKIYNTNKPTETKNLNPSLIGTLSASPGITLPSEAAILSASAFNVMNTQNTYILDWNVNSISKDLQKVTLNWNINHILLSAYKGPDHYDDTYSKTAVHINFTIPFYSGHTIQVNRTLTTNGKSLYVKQVLVTPSAVRLSFKKGSNLNEVHEFTVSLYRGGHELKLGASVPGYGYASETDDLYTYILNIPLFKQRGPVTIIVYPEFKKPDLQWSFTITIP